MSRILPSKPEKINPKPPVRKDVNQPSLYHSTPQKELVVSRIARSRGKNRKVGSKSVLKTRVQTPFLIMHSWQL